MDLSGQFAAVTKNALSLTQQQIAAAAVKANAQVMETEPVPLAETVHVDGVKGAPETAVKAGGVIVYDYSRMDLVVEFALDTLRQLSPVDSGDYARSHVVMLNGTVIGSADSARNMQIAEMKNYKPGDRLTISNLQPYTRKIEIGKKGFKAHGHVYEKAERIIQRRFHNMANVYFTYDKAPRGGGETGIRAWAYNGGAGGHSVSFNRTKKRQDRLTSQPTLVIEEPS